MHAYWLLCLFVCWLICVRVSENVDPNLPFFACKFRPFTLNFYYNVYNSEKRGNRISHYADVPNKSTRWPYFSWCFLFSWFDFRQQKPTPDRSNRGASRLGSAGMYGCVCVRAMKCQIFRPLRDQCCQKLFLQSTNYMSFFFFFLVILFCGVHISNLFAIILSFIFWG